MKIFGVLICALVAAVGAYFGQPFVRNNSDLVQIIITVFSVFAGFLIAIVAIIGDPALIPNGSWRKAELQHDAIERRLYLHVALFLLYLLTILVLFIGVVVAKIEVSNDQVWHHARIWVERLYLFLSAFSFLLSFALPWSLMRLQKSRVEAEIERRREDEGL